MKKRDMINEAIIDWRGQGLEEFASEVYSRRLPIFADEFTEIAQQHDIEVVDYQTFYEELPEEHKAGAPPRGVPAFALVNPNTFRPRIVLNTPRVDQRLFDYILHMLKHEMVHVGQYSRRTKHPSGAWDVRDRGAYFSQQDEIMAFSQSIADQLITMGARDLQDIHHMLKRVPLYNDVKRSVSDRVLKRYLKYIYLYLERELESDQAYESFQHFIGEAKENGGFSEFAQRRHDGAAKIANSAKEKGGAAMLTYHHFIVKLPYYRKAVSGKFDPKSAAKELEECNRELAKVLRKLEPKDQIPFQKIMGKIEVLGELLIKHTEYSSAI